jgi:2-succinyl-5-enolpyruvyl-6-hydroxy-3-cyclohexene-1-carboxylate synthase
MSGLDVTTSFARTLVDEWARNGITTAVVSPGSRNTR